LLKSEVKCFVQGAIAIGTVKARRAITVVAKATPEKERKWSVVTRGGSKSRKCFPTKLGERTGSNRFRAFDSLFGKE